MNRFTDQDYNRLEAERDRLKVHLSAVLEKICKGIGNPYCCTEVKEALRYLVPVAERPKTGKADGVGFGVKFIP